MINLTKVYPSIDIMYQKLITKIIIIIIIILIIILIIIINNKSNTDKTKNRDKIILFTTLSF